MKKCCRLALSGVQKVLGMPIREITKLKMLKKLKFIRKTEVGLGAGQRTVGCAKIGVFR